MLKDNFGVVRMLKKGKIAPILTNSAIETKIVNKNRIAS
jgi:hypothetical protein